MFLSRFGVKNYKCLGDVDIPLTPVHVFIGQNDSGKTSLMEAIAALYGSLKRPVEELFPQPWQGRQLVCFGSAELAIELRGQWRPGQQQTMGANPPDGIAYGFSVRFENSSEACSIGQRWLNPQGTDLRGYENPNDRFPLVPDLPARVQPLEVPAHLSRLASKAEDLQRVSQQQFDESRTQSLARLTGFLKPVEKYSLDPRAMKMPAALDPQRKFRLDRDGFGLATLLDDILSFDSGLFGKIKSEFCKYFPQFTGLRLSTEIGVSRDNGSLGAYGVTERAGKGIYLVSHGQDVRAQQASDGAILFLGILALAHLPEPPPLLLIEEPENGIYPKRLEEVVRLLKELVQRADGEPFPQIILSTHSPYVLSFFEPEEVTFLSRVPGKPDAPVRARPLTDAPQIHERMGKEEFYLGELWYNLDEEELFHGA